MKTKANARRGQASSLIPHTKKSLHGNMLVILIASIAGVSGILFGFDTGVISGAILYIRKEFQLTPFEVEVVVSSVLFGALIGCMVVGRLADYFGRRKLLLITAVFFIVATFFSAIVGTMTQFVVTRTVVGFAIGVASFTAPLYISEISPSEYRGALVSLNQLAITLGIVLSYVVDLYFSHHALAWRWMLGTGVLPAVILFVGLLFLPRSPRWLMYKGYAQAALASLRRIRGREDVHEELEEIKQTARQPKGTWQLLFQPFLRPALAVGVGLSILQQCTGINTVIYYAPTIFQMAGFSGNRESILATFGVGVVNVVFTVIGLPLLDKWGRRPLLFLGLAAMTVGLLGLSVVFYFEGAYSSSHLVRMVALLSMMLYIAAFAISLGTVMWLMISEVFPLVIRGLATSLAAGVCWGCNMLVSLTFLSLVSAFGASATFLLYMAMCLLGLIFVAKIVPETKGVHLEQIEMHLRAGYKARWLGKQANEK